MLVQFGAIGSTGYPLQTSLYRAIGAGMSDPTKVSRRLVAVFAADVEGYSRLMGADEVGAQGPDRTARDPR